MTTLIERIAKAIMEADVAATRKRSPEISEAIAELAANGMKDDYLAMARAALEAMKSPTPAMIDGFVSRALCVSIHDEGGWSEYAANQWSQMITAALNEEQGT